MNSVIQSGRRLSFRGLSRSDWCRYCLTPPRPRWAQEVCALWSAGIWVRTLSQLNQTKHRQVGLELRFESCSRGGCIPRGSFTSEQVIVLVILGGADSDEKGAFGRFEAETNVPSRVADGCPSTFPILGFPFHRGWGMDGHDGTGP